MNKTLRTAIAVFILSPIVRGNPALKARIDNLKTHFNTPIRVLLEKQTPAVTIRSLGDALYLRGFKNSRWHKLGRLMQLDKKSNNAVQHILEPNEASFFVRGGPFASDPIHYNAGLYRGAICFDKKPSGDFIVTNYVNLEDYVAGILPMEMSPSWELEALKAQAVASRTYALYMKAHPKHVFYDVEGTTQDQVYGGAGLETEKVRTAVKVTQGEYLSYRDRPIKAYFHSRCGGVTETAQVVWKEKSHEHRSRVVCPYCQRNPYNWEAAISKQSFLASLNLFQKPGENFRLLPAQRSPTGRLSSILVGLGKREQVITGDQFRSALGYARIKSTNIEWKLEGDQIVFEGKGSGHGVGMCQWGARHLARQGKGYREILKYFYPRAVFTVLEKQKDSG